MSHKKDTEVVIIGAGVMGCATAYYLAKKGIKATLIERDSVAAHASGFALGGINPLRGAGIPNPLGHLSLQSYDLHMGLSKALLEETGIDTHFKLQTTISAAFSEAEAETLLSQLEWQQTLPNFKAEWKTSTEILQIEPRISGSVIGGVITQAIGMLDPYRYTLALLEGAEHLGAMIRHGTARGLIFEGRCLKGVQLKDEIIGCNAVVLAMGPWTNVASSWLSTSLDIEPLKGQIVQLKMNGPPIPWISWGNSYVVTKPDGLVWAGTTEETVGFSETPTYEGQMSILRSVTEKLPYLSDAQVVAHTACMRPISHDGLPILGQIPHKPQVIIATGGGRKGIHLSPVMGNIAADLVIQGKTDFDITSLTPRQTVFRGDAGDIEI